MFAEKVAVSLLTCFNRACGMPISYRGGDHHDRAGKLLSAPAAALCENSQVHAVFCQGERASRWTVGNGLAGEPTTGSLA
jgi:hypothetical protein